MTSRADCIRRFTTTFSLALLLWGFGASTALPFEHARWLEDYAQLKAEMARSYANLDHIVKHRKLDLAALDARTRAELDRAESDEDAARAIRRLLAEFGDGHLRLLPPAAHNVRVASRAAQKAVEASDVARSCKEQGFRAIRDAGLPWKKDKRFTPLGTSDDSHFPAGVLAVDEKTKVGVVRIGLFGEDGYLQICERILAPKLSCDRACERGLRTEVGAEMTQAFARQVRALGDSGVTALVVDVTGNGGGTEWVEVAMRVVAAPGLRSARLGFVKHPHWEKRFQERIHAIDLDLKRADLTPSLREALSSARARAEAAMLVAGSMCDRSGVWKGDTTCTNLATSELATTGDLAARPALRLDGLDSAGMLFSPHRYPNFDGTYRGPLAVLVDANTASAAEQFAAGLKDYGGATLIGRKTHGAGCGYTGGGIPITLNQSKWRLRVPDCARLRIEGGEDPPNEVHGVQPDFVLPAGADPASVYARLILEWVHKRGQQSTLANDASPTAR